jgi:hypothetical protein
VSGDRSIGLALAFSAAVAIGCGTSPEASGPSIRFDPYQPLALVPDPGAGIAQTQGIAAALSLWNRSAETRLALAAPGTTAPSTLPIHFQSAAAPFHGLYDPTNAEVFVNDDLAGTAQAITIAHEIGHAFGLVHVSAAERPSLMNPDDLDVPPTEADVETLAGIWRRCGQLDAAASE